MKSKKLIDVIKNKDLVIPSILLTNYKELKINEKELLFLALLMSYENSICFDPIHFSKILGYEVNEIIELMSGLCTKKYINLVVKNENGKIKEYLDISYLYEKLASLIIDGEEEIKEQENSKIYNVIETELGRTLSPIEYETIAGWLNANISEELIKEALKEAVLNGVGNLKYIDKILYDWTKKGYKKASDVRKKKRSSEEEIELFEYDWLDEND
ncbi:MAG: DnaD domain-containing protein [Bacilli bacterium]